MKRSTRWCSWMVMVVVAAVVGCAEPVVEPQVEVEAAADEPLVSRPISDGHVDPLEAALLEQFATACPAPNNCVGYNSCASWSSFADCGDRTCEEGACCLGKDCQIEGNQLTQRRVSYRACYNANGEQCIAFKFTATETCRILACPS